MTFSINFIRGIHLCVSFFGSLFLLFAWLRVKKEKEDRYQNWGLVLLSLVLLTWVAIDGFKISKGALLNDIKFQTTLLSIFNNTFIIASLPFFYVGFDKLKERFALFNQGTSWAISVILINIFPIILNLVLWDDENLFIRNFMASLNVGYSVLATSLLGYAITVEFFKRNFGIPFVLLSGLISIIVIATQLNYLPLFIDNHQHVSVFLVMISHISLIGLLLILAQTWIQEEKSLPDMPSFNPESKVADELEVLARNNDKPATGERQKDSQYVQVEDGNYIKFYKEDKALVVELTMISKGIIKAPIYSSLKREYKDLLRFAVYKKAGIEIQAYGGLHKDFGGDIYKSVSDIRKKLLNPTLKELSLVELKSNQLITQKIKGSGIYELECRPEHIEIDRNSLGKFTELEKIIAPIAK